MQPAFIVWFYRTLFLSLSILILITNLIPFEVGPSVLTYPDLLYCLATSWIFRRPNYVPGAMIVVVFLLQDILMGLPVGLGAALMLGIIEYLKSRIELIRYQSFFIEWSMVALCYFIFILAYQLILTISFSQPAPTVTLIFLFLETVLLYPIIVFLSSVVLKVKSPEFPLIEVIK